MSKELLIRGNVEESGKKRYYYVSGLEKDFLERRLRKMPVTEWGEWLREQGYTLLND